MFSDVLQEIRKSALASNTAIISILVGLEKMVDVEFECPCYPPWNMVLALGFFIIPSIMAVLLMLLIQNYSWKDKDRLCKIVSSFVPAIVWLVILFLDGQYFCCANSDWLGTYEKTEKENLQKWCKPILVDFGGIILPSEKERESNCLKQSEDFFIYSEVSVFVEQNSL